jgi:hypothetical protein
MHKCTNNSVGNVYQLEQLVDNFFPYSQKQLGFDKPVSIVFQSDEDNSSKMLGKTAYYNPEGFEIVLYIDGRHPKDVMRSLSHELVHHAQNCRGDFTAQDNTGAGYAQADPHLRKMEREAYTKGNLIFRDFEDLIKTGKINIEIDFSDSGEPKMSLKEWKNNEINTKLMKKWGLLKESRNEEYLDYGKDPSDLGFAGTHRGESCADVHPEDTAAAGGDSTKGHRDWQKRGGFEEWKAAQKLKEGGPGDEHYRFDEKERGDELEEGCGDVAYREEDELEEGSWFGAGRFQQMADDEDDPTDVPTATALEKAQTQAAGDWGKEVRGGRPVRKAKGSDVSARDRRAGSKHLGTQTWAENKKISVREAKEMTRRIIERIKKESK